MIRGGGTRWVAHPVMGTRLPAGAGRALSLHGRSEAGAPGGVGAADQWLTWILHPNWRNLAGIASPWVELLSGALLVLGIAPASAAMVAAGCSWYSWARAFWRWREACPSRAGASSLPGRGPLSWRCSGVERALLVLALQVMWCGNGRRVEESRSRNGHGLWTGFTGLGQALTPWPPLPEGEGNGHDGDRHAHTTWASQSPEARTGRGRWGKGGTRTGMRQDGTGREARRGDRRERGRWLSTCWALTSGRRGRRRSW